MKVLPFSPPTYNTSQHFWAKDMGQYVLLLGNRVDKQAIEFLVFQKT
jgi:hypothetical protein